MKKSGDNTSKPKSRVKIPAYLVKERELKKRQAIEEKEESSSSEEFQDLEETSMPETRSSTSGQSPVPTPMGPALIPSASRGSGFSSAAPSGSASGGSSGGGGSQPPRRPDDLTGFDAAATGSDAEVKAARMLHYSDFFQYDGFDPYIIKEKFRILCEARRHNFDEMMGIAAMLIVIRGTKMSKIKDKSSPQLKEKLLQLDSMLSTKRDKALTKEDITLPRLAACMPDLIAHLVTKVAKCPIADYESVHPLIRSLHLAPVLPSGPQWDNVALVNMSYIVQFENLTGQRVNNEQRKQFWRASHGSRLMTQNARTALMAKLGINPECCQAFLQQHRGYISGLTVVQADPISEDANMQIG